MSPAEYRAHREKLGLTQAGLASLLEVTRETVNRRESGEQPITHEAALAISSLQPSKTKRPQAPRTARMSHEPERRNQRPEMKHPYRIIDPATGLPTEIPAYSGVPSVEAAPEPQAQSARCALDALLAAVVQWSEARKMRCLSCDEGQESAPCTCFDGVAAIDAAEKKLQEIADEAANGEYEPRRAKKD